MIVRARAVVTADGLPIENGAVAISGNRIIDVGTFGEVSTQSSGQEVIDLGDQALLPGLINAHCHLDYTCLRGKISRQNSFADWIRAIKGEKSKLSAQDYVTSINQGFAEAKRFGTTTIVNLTGFPELIPSLPVVPIRTWWCAELIDVRSPDRTDKLVASALQLLKSEQNYGLAPHAPYTASKSLYKRCEETSEDVLLTTHLAESQEEMEMFRDGSGRLYDLMESIGRGTVDCGRGTPLEHFLESKQSSNPKHFQHRSHKDWLIAHLNELTERDFDLLKKMRTKFHIVHSPGSHNYFGHSRFPFKRLHALGFNVSLGTDSLASNTSLSLFAEMRAFQRNEPGVSPQKILEMVTVNPASALRRQNTLGRIRPGFRADLIAVPCSAYGNLFEEIVAFDGDIPWLMINGQR